jgi:hypothetical protein
MFSLFIIQGIMGEFNVLFLGRGWDMDFIG